MSTSITSDDNTTSPENTSIDVPALKELAKRSLIDALNAINGAKTLVLDAALAGPLGLVTEVSLLKHYGVDKMFWLEPGPLNATTTNIVYLCRPHIKHIKVIAEQIKKHSADGQKHVYNLIITPRPSTLASQILEEEGVLGEVTISSYNLQFIPLEEDVLSLEHDNAFKEIWMDGDETAVYNSAQALLTLQRLYGLFPRILGKGDHAEKLAKLLVRLNAQHPPGPGSVSGISDKFDSLIIIDRRVDMITPMLTQLTYEGLIDEHLSIKNSHVLLPAALVTPPAPGPAPGQASTSTSALSTTPVQSERKKKYQLSSSSDPLFGELRDLNFAVIGAKLSSVAHRLDNDYQARHKAQTVAQLKDFVGKLGSLQNEHQALRLHTGLSELLVPTTRSQLFNKSLEVQQNLLASYNISSQLNVIEDMIAHGADRQTVFRLLVLASVCGGGVKAKALENLKREILQGYGYDLLPLLLNLDNMSLLHSQPPPPHTTAWKLPYTSLRKQLRLLLEEVPNEETHPSDISYVYSGYAPLSIRLVQCIAQMNGVLASFGGSLAAGGADEGNSGTKGAKVNAHPIVGWKGFEDVVTIIPGKTVDVVQQAADGTIAAAPSILPKEKSTTTVVFFLGGCTYTEISAIRWMGKRLRGRKFVIATTGIVNGNSLIDALTPESFTKVAQPS